MGLLITGAGGWKGAVVPEDLCILLWLRGSRSLEVVGGGT